MARRGGDRGSARKKRERKAPRPPVERRTVEHPKFGSMPLVPWTWTAPDGSTRELWRYDPDYEPPLPRGAVRGDLRRQEFCIQCNFPYYYYEDIERACVQCKQAFTFAAAEQKYWYETLQFNFASRAIRCPACRKQRRTDTSFREQIAQALHAAEAGPRDPAAQLALAEATAAFVERFGHGQLDRGLAAARRARRLKPDLAEARYWEGELQALAGRTKAAREALEAYVAQAQGSGRLATAARRRLDALGAP